MDLELTFWIAVFMGGYAAVLGWLLRVAMRKPASPGDRDPR